MSTCPQAIRRITWANHDICLWVSTQWCGWLPDSIFLSTSWDVDFCIRGVAYTGLCRKKYFFIRDTILKNAHCLPVSWESLLLAWSCPVFTALKTDFQLTLHLNEQDSCPEVKSVSDSPANIVFQNIGQWFLKYMASLASHSGWGFFFKLSISLSTACFAAAISDSLWIHIPSRHKTSGPISGLGGLF